MLIELRMDIPVGEEHGLTKGKRMETCANPDPERYRHNSVWVLSDANELVQLKPYEWRVVDEDLHSDTSIPDSMPTGQKQS